MFSTLDRRGGHDKTAEDFGSGAGRAHDATTAAPRPERPDSCRHELKTRRTMVRATRRLGDEDLVASIAHARRVHPGERPWDRELREAYLLIPTSRLTQAGQPSPARCEAMQWWRHASSTARTRRAGRIGCAEFGRLWLPHGCSDAPPHGFAGRTPAARACPAAASLAQLPLGSRLSSWTSSARSPECVVSVPSGHFTVKFADSASASPKWILSSCCPR